MRMTSAFDVLMRGRNAARAQVPAEPGARSPPKGIFQRVPVLRAPSVPAPSASPLVVAHHSEDGRKRPRERGMSSASTCGRALLGSSLVLRASDEQVMFDNSEEVKRYASSGDREDALQSVATGTYSVLMSALRASEVELVKQELTLRPKPSLVVQGALPPPIPVYDVDARHGRLLVPRPYGVHRWGPAARDCTCVGRDISEAVRCVARPRDEAQRVMLRAMKSSYAHLRDTGSEWILAKADCGCGKTIMAVMHWLAAVEPELHEYSCTWQTPFGRPPVALFMPPTKILRDQWACEVRSICPQLQVFIMSTKSDKIPSDADCIIALPHTVCLCAPGTFDHVGFTVLDEAHHLTAHTFWQAVKNVEARRVLFLTATPRRNDGLTKELLMMTGPMAAHVERPAMPVDARFVLYRRGARRTLRYGKQLAYGKMLNWLCEDETRNRDIASYISRALLEEDAHRILVISERSDKVKHLEILAQYVVEDLLRRLRGGGAAAPLAAGGGGAGDAQLTAHEALMRHELLKALRRDEPVPEVPPERLKKSRVPLPVLDPPADCARHGAQQWFLAHLVSVIRPGMLSYEQELAKCARVVFAPRKSCDQGFNKSDFSHEFYASPFTDVEQCDGRVQRTAPNKRKCIIYHVVDTHDPYRSYGLKVWRWRTHADRRRRKYVCRWVDEDLRALSASEAMRELGAEDAGGWRAEGAGDCDDAAEGAQEEQAKAAALGGEGSAPGDVLARMSIGRFVLAPRQ